MRVTRWLVLGLASLTASARADVVLHEFVPADPRDDLRLGATTSDGAMAAAIETQSGPVSSPDLERPSERHGSTYGAERSPPGSGGSFRLDRDTSRPESVSYDDPFTPGIAPYKREFAYDLVDDRLDLVVRDPSLVRFAVGGTARAEDDQFYADLDVDLVEGQPVRIPTVGPGARLLAVRSVPEANLQVFRDSAENWFVKGDRQGRVRLVLHIAEDRAAFGSPFADIEWPRLWRHLPPVPGRAKDEGIRVARQIGVVDGTGPSEALRILVRYFRSFAPSNEHPKGTGGAELYRELTLSRKGVCRHRSYAFVVTALALGIPSRFVRNEAHAWVEVFDGTRWHRIDLGGAADRLDSPDTGRIPHVPPRDPFEWPAGAESGQAMADRARALSRSGAAGRAAATTRTTGAPAPATSVEAPEAAPEDLRAKPTVTLTVGGVEARRGSRLEISGRIESSAGPCTAARVDLFLEPRERGQASPQPLGTLVTGADGRYQGRIVVPFTVPPGDYDVRASTPGNLSCGEGQSP